MFYSSVKTSNSHTFLEQPTLSCELINFNVRMQKIKQLETKTKRRIIYNVCTFLIRVHSNDKTHNLNETESSGML